MREDRQLDDGLVKLEESLGRLKVRPAGISRGEFMQMADRRLFRRRIVWGAVAAAAIVAVCAAVFISMHPSEKKMADQTEIVRLEPQPGSGGAVAGGPETRHEPASLPTPPNYSAEPEKPDPPLSFFGRVRKYPAVIVVSLPENFQNMLIRDVEGCNWLKSLPVKIEKVIKGKLECGDFRINVSKFLPLQMKKKHVRPNQKYMLAVFELTRNEVDENDSRVCGWYVEPSYPSDEIKWFLPYDESLEKVAKVFIEAKSDTDSTILLDMCWKMLNDKAISETAVGQVCDLFVHFMLNEDVIGTENIQFELPAVRRPEDGKPPSRAEIENMVGQLDDGDFSVRQNATRKLLSIGPAAIPVMETIASLDSEVESRKKFISRQIYLQQILMILSDRLARGQNVEDVADAFAAAVTAVGIDNVRTVIRNDLILPVRDWLAKEFKRYKACLGDSRAFGDAFPTFTRDDYSMEYRFCMVMRLLGILKDKSSEKLLSEIYVTSNNYRNVKDPLDRGAFADVARETIIFIYGQEAEKILKQLPPSSQNPEMPTR